MPNYVNVQEELYQWAAGDLGRSLISEEARCLSNLLANLYGPIAVQCGNSGFDQFLDSSAAVHHFLAPLPMGPEVLSPEGIVRCVPEAMPFDTRSVSVLLLPHVLEFSPDPHQVLREASRVLAPEGHLVLVGFNPYSLWGVRRLAGKVLRRLELAPWCGRFISLSRVKDWVSVLGFEASSGRSAYYLPPIKSPALRSRLDFLQKAGDRWWPMLAATFILIARKRELGVTPIVPSWKKRKRLAPGLAEPVTRNG